MILSLKVVPQTSELQGSISRPLTEQSALLSERAWRFSWAHLSGSLADSPEAEEVGLLLPEQDAQHLSQEPGLCKMGREPHLPSQENPPPPTPLLNRRQEDEDLDDDPLLCLINVNHTVQLINLSVMYVYKCLVKNLVIVHQELEDIVSSPLLPKNSLCARLEKGISFSTVV